MSSKNTVTTNELLEAINQFSGHMDVRLDGVEKRLGRMESRMDEAEATMVTKDYLDDKLYSLKGDLITIAKREDKKVTALIELLIDKKLIAKKEANKILAFELFPRA
jgi:hypothetical protein